MALPEFALGRYSVTQVQYEAVMGRNPSRNWGKQNPLDTSSWMNAVRYCNGLSSQLGLTPRYDIEEAQPGASLRSSSN